MNLRPYLLFVVITVIPYYTYAQIPLSAMVADSATMQPMGNVNIKIKNRGHGTITDIRGYFSLPAYDYDTVIISRVGYYTKTLQVKRVRETAIVFLTEERKTLAPIVINAEEIIPWLKKLPPESPWKNATTSKGFTETPGFQGIQTFGPGYVLKGPISRFSKYERERKKLKKVQEENYRSRHYADLVNAPEVKGKIMEEHNLNEDEYYRLLAKFNEKNKDIIYALDGNDVIALLLIFYAENVKKK